MKKLFFLVIAFLFILGSYTITLAETIRLSDGSIIQGRILDFDEKGITFKVLRNGATIKLHWRQIGENDKERLRKEFGLEMPDYSGVITVKGDRIETFDGNSYLGKIIEEDKTRVVMEFLGFDGKKEREIILKRKIRDIFKNISIPAHYLLPKEEVYQQILLKNNPADAKGHYLMALYCLDIGLYSQGLYHIQECLSYDETMKNSVKEIENKLITLQNAWEFRDSMNEINRLIRRDRFSSAYIHLKEILDKKDLENELKNIAAEVMIKFEIALTDYISIRWYRLINVTAHNFILKNDPKIAEARTYATGQMEKDIIQTISDEINKDNLENPVFNEKFIVDLFKKRNKDKYPVIKVSLDADALQIKMSGTAQADTGDNNSDLDLQGILEKIRSGTLTQQEREELWKKYRELRGGGAQRNVKTEEPDDFDYEGTYFQGLNPRPSPNPGTNQPPRRPPNIPNNPGNRNNPGTTNNPNTNTRPQATIDDIWKIAASSVKRNYVIYYYCSSNKNIELRKEQRRGRFYYGWFR